jgi:diguanylate cyclase (GGDEF)-like protein
MATMPENARAGRFSGAHPLAARLRQGTWLCAACFVAGKLGLDLAVQYTSATPVWPPAGIALASFLLWGPGVWPALFLGAFLVNVTTAGSTAACLAIAAGHTLGSALAARLAARYAGGVHAFDRVPDVFRFAALAAAGAAVSATVGALALRFDGLVNSASLAVAWLTWWLGDAVGGLLVAPPLLLWARGAREGWTRARAAEGLALVLVVVTASLVVFGGFFPARTQDYPLEFVCLLPLVWAAVRFEPRGAAAAILLCSALAVSGTVRGYGPFARGSATESLLLLQAFLALAALTTLALAAAVSERRRYEQQLLYLVEHDPLTGVLSRKRFESELRHELAMSLRYGTRGAVLFVDLDEFKQVNDQLGHRAGDQLLVKLARLLKGRLRDSDLLARLGGDEFAVLLPNADGSQAQAVASQLAAAIGQDGVVEGSPLRVTASLGIALYPEHGLSADELLSRADGAMYGAKQAGGNRALLHVADEATRQTAAERIAAGPARRKGG